MILWCVQRRVGLRAHRLYVLYIFCHYYIDIIELYNYIQKRGCKHSDEGEKAATLSLVGI